MEHKHVVNFLMSNGYCNKKNQIIIENCQQKYNKCLQEFDEKERSDVYKF